MPSAVANALPLAPPEQVAREAAQAAAQAALEQMFSDAFLPIWGASFPVALPAQIQLSDVEVLVMDPTGQRAFFRGLIDAAILENDGRSTQIRINGNLQPPRARPRRLRPLHLYR